MDKIVLFDDKQNCCGCGACSVVCPQNTIHMKEDPSGFRYPEIEYANCISCGACKRVCAFQKEGTLFEPRSTYAAATRNTDIMKSASGGIFASFAKWFLEQGGVVYGAILESRNGTLVPLHIGIDRIEALEALQGSKYVQSDLADVFSAIKRQLHEGRYVLFSGTPCQVDALRSYLGNKAYESLLLIDIICHGVPSARMFQDYIRMLEKKCKGKIVNFTFRDKAYGWGIIGSYEFLRPDGSRMKRKLLLRESSYYSLFNDSHIYRENCYSCPYAGRLRAGDLTIGVKQRIRKYCRNTAANGTEKRGFPVCWSTTSRENGSCMRTRRISACFSVILARPQRLTHNCGSRPPGASGESRSWSYTVCRDMQGWKSGLGRETDVNCGK